MWTSTDVDRTLPSGPVERFVKFLDMEGHSAKQLTQGLLKFRKENNADIKKLP